jgi:hypothetical protein
MARRCANTGSSLALDAGAISQTEKEIEMKALRVLRLFKGLRPVLAAGSIFTLAAFTLIGPNAALAEAALPIDGTFSVNFTATPASPGIYSVEAHGIGSTSHAGNLFFDLTKTVDFTNGTLQGNFKMTDETGDTITGTYAGVIRPPDSKLFAPFSGLLTLLAGTGRYQNVKGTVSFTALANMATAQAVYSFKGVMSFPGAGRQ